MNTKLNFSSQAGPANWLWKGNENLGCLLTHCGEMQCQWGTELEPNPKPVLHRCSTTATARNLSPFAALTPCRYSIGICCILEKLWKSLIKITTTVIKTNIHLLFHICSSHSSKYSYNLYNYQIKWVLLFPSF